VGHVKRRLSNAAGERGGVMTRRKLGFLIAAACLYLTVFGFLTGMAVERVRFDSQRSALLQHLAATEERLHTHLMDLERQTQLPQRRDEAEFPREQ
jgi:hypothetical protein